MAIEEYLKQARDLLQKVNAGARTGKPFLVVVMRSFCVQGLIVRRQGGEVRVLRFAQADFESTVRSPKIKLARIMDKLGGQKFSRIYIVSPEVMSFVLDLPNPGGGKTKAGPKLENLARWEMASYLEYPPEQGLLRVIPLPENTEEDEFYAPLEEGSEGESVKPVLASVFSSRVYGALSRLCGSYKKKLSGVAPEEVFALTARMVAGSGCQCVMVDCRLHDIVCVMVEHGLPVAMIRGEVEAGEAYGLSLARALDILGPPPESRVYLVGEAALECRDSMDSDRISSYSWKVLEEINSPDGSWGPLPGKYASALGAALDREENLTINDSVPHGRRIRSNVHALPLILLALLMLGMGGSYGMLQVKKARLEERMREYKQEKKELERVLAKDRRIRDRYGDLKRKLSGLEDSRDYLTSRLPGKNRALVHFLARVTRSIPGEISLDRLRQVSDETWYLKGVSIGLDPIIKLQDRLDGISGVRSVKREKARPMKKAEGNVSHEFEIRVRRGKE